MYRLLPSFLNRCFNCFCYTKTVSCMLGRYRDCKHHAILQLHLLICICEKGQDALLDYSENDTTTNLRIIFAAAKASLT